MNVLVTMGDPAGIGPEIVLRGVGSPSLWKGTAVVVGDLSVLRTVKERLGINAEIVAVQSIDDAEGLETCVPVLDVGAVGDVSKIEAGRISRIGGEAAVRYMERAVELVLNGKADGIVTAPINKESLREAGYRYKGHTEMLSELTGTHGVTMFMVDNLKIFFHSRHVALKKAIEDLTVEGVAGSIENASACLRSIGYDRHVLALAALNPHSSDGGLFGHEEERILGPAIRRARDRGVDVRGPVPADTVFFQALNGAYDGVVSLYHDQGHIAAKTHDFDRTVSVTLGLPFVRTSVDHGTAFDIAWSGRARSTGMEEAIKACFELAAVYRAPDLIQE